MLISVLFYSQTSPSDGSMVKFSGMIAYAKFSDDRARRLLKGALTALLNLKRGSDLTFAAWRLYRDFDIC